MEKYFVANGKIVNEAEAEQINKRNYELLSMSEKTGDWDFLSDIVFLIPLQVACELV